MHLSKFCPVNEVLSLDKIQGKSSVVRLVYSLTHLSNVLSKLENRFFSFRVSPFPLLRLLSAVRSAVAF